MSSGPTGSIPHTTLNGDIPVVLLRALLYANSACGSNKSHAFNYGLINTLKSVPRVWFVTSVWPFVWGWQEVLWFNFVPSFFHNVIQMWLKNLISRSKPIDWGIPINLVTSLKYSSSILVASLVLLQAMKWAIFEKQFTTTKIESLLHWVFGNPKTKSILTSTQGAVETGNSVYNPYGSKRLLATWQVAHLFKMSWTSFDISSQ